MIQWLRSLVFIGQMYLAMLVIAILYFPWAVLSPAGAHAACHAYCRWVIWTLDWMTGFGARMASTTESCSVG